MNKKNRYDKHELWLTIAQAMTVIILATVTGCTLPVVEAFKTTVALAVAYVIPLSLYRRCGHATVAGRWVLLAAWIALCAIAIPFLRQCTVDSGASFAMPCLTGDAANYYDWALCHYDGSVVEPSITFWGYSLMMIGLWHLLGLSVIWPVAMNVMATLLTIVLTGMLAARLAGSRRALAATVAMAMLTVQGYFMSQGGQLLKEPWIYLAITIIAHSLFPEFMPNQASHLYKRSQTDNTSVLHTWRYALIYALGCFLLAAVRAKYVNFLFIGITLMAIASRLRHWRHDAVLLGITLVCWWLGMAMTDNYTVVQQVNNVTGDGGMADMFSPDGPYQRLMGDYYHYPAWNKVLHLPMACAVQWIIPFPWLPQGDTATWLGVAPRLRLGWYVLSGVVIYFYLFQSWRRGWHRAAWAWFPLVCYAGIAYMTSGTVSRYILPFQPWWMAMGAATLVQCANKRSFRISLTAYVMAMAVVLAACFHLTH